MFTSEFQRGAREFFFQLHLTRTRHSVHRKVKYPSIISSVKIIVQNSFFRFFLLAHGFPKSRQSIKKFNQKN